MSNSFSTYLADKVIDHITGKTSYTAPTVYVGFSSTTPTTAGTNITEPSGGAYARVATTGSTWNAASANSTTNALAITFTTATADWLSGANLTYGVLYDAPTAGNFLGLGVLSVAKNVLNGDTVSIPVAGLTITLN